jgi:hypothetical protein
MSTYAELWDDGMHIHGGADSLYLTDNINNNIGIYLVLFILAVLYYYRKDVNVTIKNNRWNPNLFSNYLTKY